MASTNPYTLGNFPFSQFWGSWAPFKVVVFSCKFLLDRFPSREELFKRKVIVDLILTMCYYVMELLNRLPTYLLLMTLLVWFGI